MSRGGPEQLRFETVLVGAADRVVSDKIATPVQRWRKMVVLFDPPEGSNCSCLAFRAVAAVLANFADRNGSSCFPSVATIGEDAGIKSRRQVQYALAALEARGLIVRDKRGGRGRTTRYELVCRRAVEKPVHDPVDSGQLTLERVRESTPKGCGPLRPRSVIEDRQLRRPGLIRVPSLVTT